MRLKSPSIMMLATRHPSLVRPACKTSHCQIFLSPKTRQRVEVTGKSPPQSSTHLCVPSKKMRMVSSSNQSPVVPDALPRSSPPMKQTMHQTLASLSCSTVRATTTKTTKTSY
ncbi:hypothetical protein BC835DRAFT_1340333 [Cytidiella melzeri]|nr:hypothetical protein BC835DRAFT_1340333 [Cytidiella melzeri]